MGCIVTSSVLNLFLLFSFNDILFSTPKKKKKKYIPNGTVQQGQYKKIELTNLINS